MLLFEVSMLQLQGMERGIVGLARRVDLCTLWRSDQAAYAGDEVTGTRKRKEKNAVSKIQKEANRGKSGDFLEARIDVRG